MSFWGEGSFVDVATSLFLLTSSYLAVCTKEIPFCIRLMVSLSLVFLGLDELMMIHECMKITIFEGMHSSSMRDITSLIYYFSGLFGMIFIRKMLLKSHLHKILFAFIIAFATISMLGDVFGFAESLCNECVEELSELGMGFMVLLLFFFQKRYKFSLGALVLLLAAACIFSAANSIKKTVCPYLTSPLFNKVNASR